MHVLASGLVLVARHSTLAEVMDINLCSVNTPLTVNTLLALCESIICTEAVRDSLICGYKEVFHEWKIVFAAAAHSRVRNTPWAHVH